MKAMMTKMKDFFMPQDEYEEEEIEVEREPVQKPRVSFAQPIQSSKVLPLNQNAQMEILNFTMSSYEMTGEVSSYIKNRKPIIVNMQKLSPSEIQRAVDFLTGACYALDGTVERVGDNHIFIFAPQNVNISPEHIKQKNIWPTL
jgi:cell division inhibitor SepF